VFDDKPGNIPNDFLKVYSESKHRWFDVGFTDSKVL